MVVLLLRQGVGVVEEVHGTRPLLSLRGHLARSSDGLGSVSVTFGEEQEGLCRPRSGCSPPCRAAGKQQMADRCVRGRAATCKVLGWVWLLGCMWLVPV